MKTFKQIIQEAKFEPGGPDVGKLFGDRGKYAPKKGTKEKTASQRMKSGELTPNINRPTGLEASLKIHPPENAQFIEPTANQRESGKKIIDRMITPHHPGIPEPEPKTQKPSSVKQVVRFTNNVHHDIIGTNNKKILEMLKETYPTFIKHSDKLTSEHSSNIESDSREYSRRRSAHRVVTTHFDNLRTQIENSVNRKSELPNDKKFGSTRIKTFETSHDFPGTLSMKMQFHPMKTHISGSNEIKDLLSHLERHTGHEWYIHPDSGNWMVGTENSPLVLATDINHPDLGDPDDDNNDGGNQQEEPKPRNPGGRAPTRPKTPQLV